MIQYLKQYESELIDKELVRQNQVPYMVGWVRHFLFLGNPEEAVYVDILGKEGKESSIHSLLPNHTTSLRESHHTSGKVGDL